MHELRASSRSVMAVLAGKCEGAGVTVRAYGVAGEGTTSPKCSRTLRSLQAGLDRWSALTAEGQSPARPPLVPVAQLDRAHGFYPCGWEFDSLRGRHYNVRIELGRSRGGRPAGKPRSLGNVARGLSSLTSRAPRLFLLSTILLAGCDGSPSSATVFPFEIADAQTVCAENGGLMAIKVYTDLGGNTYKRFTRCKNGALFESPSE